MIKNLLFSVSFLLPVLLVSVETFARDAILTLQKPKVVVTIVQNTDVNKVVVALQPIQKPCTPQPAVIMGQDTQKTKPQSLVDLIRKRKSNLKHVKPSAQNQYAKFILAQKSPYDAKLDFNSFIKKLQIEDAVVIANRTPRRARVQIEYVAKEALGISKTETVTIAPYELYIFEKDYNVIFTGISFADKNSTSFLNPKFTQDGHLQISIETTQDRNFLHQYHHFNFTSTKFADDYLHNPDLSQEEKDFRNGYNGSVDYMEYIAHQEGTSLAGIDQQRRTLYAKNNMGTLLKYYPNLLDSTVHRIPLITHKIWVTSDTNPKNPAMSYIKWLENSIEHNPTSAGWIHYFWVESKAKLPELTKLLKNHPHIRLKELKDLDTKTFLTGDLYKQCIQEKKFGKATDIIRLELLKLFGGFYLDTDYELFQSLIPYSKAYDMVVGLEPMSVYLCNAFIGACPNHRVITKALDLINRNLSDKAPDYVKNAPNNGPKTIVETGPIAFTLAFALEGGKGDNQDIVLPPLLIYPAQTDEYPKKQVITPDGKKPAKAIGGHYWRTAWMDPGFGSEG